MKSAARVPRFKLTMERGAGKSLRVVVIGWFWTVARAEQTAGNLEWSGEWRATIEDLKGAAAS